MFVVVAAPIGPTTAGSRIAGVVAALPIFAVAVVKWRERREAGAR